METSISVGHGRAIAYAAPWINGSFAILGNPCSGMLPRFLKVSDATLFQHKLLDQAISGLHSSG
jgi:hypothetical protein